MNVMNFNDKGDKILLHSLQGFTVKEKEIQNIPARKKKKKKATLM